MSATKENKFGLPEIKMPEVKFHKNGYEIRADILGMAKDLVQTEFSAKFNGWALTSTKDQNGTIVTSVQMPDFPGVDKVLETAEKMYEFVNKAGK